MQEHSGTSFQFVREIATEISAIFKCATPYALQLCQF
jgi:hypothetical protein